MSKVVLTILFLLSLAAAPVAQERPLSPPERAPVPLSDRDQRASEEAAMKEATAKGEEKSAASTLTTSNAQQVSPPAGLPDRHISSGNAAVDAIVYEAAARHGLDPCLILSVMKAESAFNRMAVSPKGASGLMQLMPATASRFGVKDIFDPKENIFAGARYLRWLLDRFGGDVRLALAGYNAGEGAIEFYGLRIPPFLETQNYVRKIYGRYSALHTGAPSEKMAAPAPAPANVNTNAGKLPTYNQVIRPTASLDVTSGARSGQ